MSSMSSTELTKAKTAVVDWLLEIAAETDSSITAAALVLEEILEGKATSTEPKTQRIVALMHRIPATQLSFDSIVKAALDKANIK